MRKTLTVLTGFSLLVFMIISCNSNKDKKTEETSMKEPKIIEENVSYQLDTLTMNNFIAYDENVKGKRPAILVIHEWWGLNDYVKSRVRQLASLGYIAMAVDMYGNNKMGNNPDEAGKLATPFYMNPELARPIFTAAINKLKSYSETNGDRLAAI